MSNRIVRAAIYPAIGVARAGNSREEDGYFFGPEVPDGTKIPPGGFKDKHGALKRQAARFRIYGFDAAGKVTGELTLDDAEIEWTVAVANTKAAWYNFNGPMDIDGATPVGRRNPGFQGAARDHLRIVPKPEKIAGPNHKGVKFGGKFMQIPVDLGEVSTDKCGRLMFLGGHGMSGTPDPENYIAQLSNNKWWYDDLSDGPVKARVRIKGEKENIPVDSAWVVTAPPNYAPHISPIRSLYDAMVEGFQQRWPQPAKEVSFKHDVLPLLRRFVRTQWVNKGFFLEFGWAGLYNYNFMRGDYLAALASKSSTHLAERTRVLNLMRSPSDTEVEKHLWPQIYGDKITGFMPVSMLPLTQQQYAALQLWAAGNFKEDLGPKENLTEDIKGPDCICQVDLQLRPDLLTETALRDCSGGPFDTGCEMTWIMRQPLLYSKPFRIRHRRPEDAEQDFGDTLTPDVAVAVNGPLYGSGPGDITRWMSVPWHCDVAGCGSGYETKYDPYLPSLWPASVPNQVLTEDQLAVILDEKASREKRLRAFGERAEWQRFLKGSELSQMQQMVTDFDKMGVVVRREIEPEDPEIPKTVFVESEVGFPKIP